MYNIYCITNEINNKKYVGLTRKTLDERWKSHLNTLKKKKKYAIHHAMSKYGVENFTIELLESGVEKDREYFWIKELKTRQHGYNMTVGGDGTHGLKFDADSKRILSELAIENHKYKKIGMYGKTHTEETKRKMSESQKSLGRTGINNPLYGKKRSSDAIQKMRKPKSEQMKRKLSQTLKAKHQEHTDIFAGSNNPMYGKKHSDETRELISQVLKQRASIKQECEHCGKSNDASNHKRWHGNNCKRKEVQNG
jgi:group I intron endonuclease